MMGNSVKRPDAPNIATIFVGIMVGIIFGSLPFAVPRNASSSEIRYRGWSADHRYFDRPIRLSLQTGDLYDHLCQHDATRNRTGIVHGKCGNQGWRRIRDTVVQGDGLKYVGCGFLITVIPILIIGTIARLKYKFNYFTIMGMLAGTYTDPPALAYANASCSKEAPAVGYSTVYPLSMFLRIFSAQIVVLFFCG